MSAASRGGGGLAFALLAGLIILPALPVVAQEWRVGAQGGWIRSSIDPAAEAVGSFSVGLRYEAPRSAFRLVGGAPSEREEPLWGSISLWRRVASRGGRGFLAGLDLSGVGFVAHDRRSARAPAPPPGGGILDPSTPQPIPLSDRSGQALAVQALPLVGWESDDVQLHARGGVSHFAARLGDTRLDRTVALADLQLTLLPTRSVAIIPAVRHYRPENEDGVTYSGLTMIAASALTRLSGSIGHWSGVSGTGTPWAAAVRFRVGPGVALELAARHDAFDPLYLQPSQTSGSAGVSIRIGGRSGPPPLPVPAAYAEGRATLELSAKSTTSPPSIAGDFTDWKPVRMERQGKVWRHTLRLPPGVYRYAFVDAEGRWFVPEGVPGRRDDGMGGHVAVVVVE